MVKKLLFVGLMGLFLLMGVGCCPITKLNIQIDVDESFRAMYGNRPVNVDIVGVNSVEHKRWESYSMTNYWAAGDTLRATSTDKTVTLQLDPSKKEPVTVSAGDPHWATWLSGATDKDPPRIYILVQLPGTYRTADDKPGNADSRRQILPTGSCRWDNSLGHPPTVKLILRADRLETLTPPKLDKGSQ
jgi:hypothetical protein